VTDKALTLYIRRFFSGTFLSRVSGMGRDLMMAFAFGDHPSVAAFMVAFRLSNLFRRLLGEGPFQSAFIPHFEGLRVQDPEKAAVFFRKITLFLSLILFTITLLTEGGIAGILAFGKISEGNREILTLTGWLFPGILFICLYGLNISLLNCFGSFFVPSVAPFICNVIWIGAAFFLRNSDPSFAMMHLAKWVVIGFMCQWLFTLPLTLKNNAGQLKEWFKIKIPPEVKSFARSFALGVIGVGAMQINAFFDALFARHADIRGPAYLWYSIRLEQLALAIFGIACVSTIVPRLSRAIKSGNHEEAQTLFSFSYRRIMSIMIPCTFAILALGTASINLVYGHGHFSDLAISKTTFCLWSYALGLVPTTLVILFSAIFYAQNNFRTPMWISLATVGINLALNTLFVLGLKLGAISTALATSISALINSWILYRMISKEWKPDLLLGRVMHLIFAGIFALGCVFVSDYSFFQTSTIIPVLTQFSRDFSAQVGLFSLQLVAFILGLTVFAKAFKSVELIELFQTFFVRKKDNLNA
jgi:putative peptidoglycan lipid II flippase